MPTIYTSLYQPEQKFNNKIKWEEFRTLANWNDVITHFKKRIENFFFSPIELLYKCIFPGRIKYVHNFPISNICWSLLDLFTQLDSGSSTKGNLVDNFLLNNKKYFRNIGTAITLANSYQELSSTYPHTVYDIFRNKPFHNAMVKGLGSLNHLAPEVFTISTHNVNINGKSLMLDIITENPIKLFKAINKYFKRYILKLRKSRALQKNFKNRIEELFEFKFEYI